MMTLKIGEKELQVKFGFRATLKTRLLSRMAKLDVKQEESDGMENVENLMMLLPEFLLVGLQKFHSDEFGFDLDTNKGKEEQIEKVFDIIDDYLDANEDTDAIELYNSLTQEMLNNGFLKKQFQEELEQAKKQAKEK